MIQWQYKTTKLATSGFLKNTVKPEALDGLLNRFGKDGWELVELIQVPGEITRGEFIAVFKRPAPHPKGMSDTRGECPKCHYDLRGADHAFCPECGWSGD